MSTPQQLSWEYRFWKFQQLLSPQTSTPDKIKKHNELWKLTAIRIEKNLQDKREKSGIIDVSEMSSPKLKHIPDTMSDGEIAKQVGSSEFFLKALKIYQAAQEDSSE
uniref:Uncharacterized protein n=1 Tax=Pithovirus LCPAC103 TaxID=2506588 RepID=A0A481Z3D5_9VIRU|nr:MAG: hypothetical protein LCPAC103_00450 [Pithovirus LCPAC103]